MLPFDPQLLECIQDISEGVELDTATHTLDKLGFKHLDLGCSSATHAIPAHRGHAWVHPAGLIVGAVQSKNSPHRLNSIRVGSLLNLGWNSIPKTQTTSIFSKGDQWLEPDGQLYIQSNVPLTSDLSLVSHFRELHASQARLMSFGEWERRASQGKARFWLFVFGNERLKDMGEDIDLPALMGEVDPGLGAFVRDRMEHIDNPGSYGGHPGLFHPLNREFSQRDAHRYSYVREIGKHLKLDRPTQAQSGTIQQWLAPPGPKWTPCYETLLGGLSQGALLAIGGFDHANQQALLKWIQNAPPSMLETMIATRDCTGHNLVSSLFKSMVDFSKLDQEQKGMDMGSFTAKCLDRLVDRVGKNVVERGLHLDGTPTGQILGFLFDPVLRKVSIRTISDHVMVVLNTLEQAGISLDDNAVLGSFQKPLLVEVGVETRDIGGPEKQRKFLDGKPGCEAWNEVLAKLVSMKMNSTVVQARQGSGPGPRF